VAVFAPLLLRYDQAPHSPAIATGT